MASEHDAIARMHAIGLGALSRHNNNNHESDAHACAEWSDAMDDVLDDLDDVTDACASHTASTRPPHDFAPARHVAWRARAALAEGNAQAALEAFARGADELLLAWSDRVTAASFDDAV
jgi:hypothetical protein